VSADLLTPEQAAERMGLEWPKNKAWIYKHSREWFESNRGRGIPTTKLGRYYRYDPEALTEWLGRVQRGEAEA
jgi:hypothetical protein